MPQQLGIELITTSVSLAKGRVERLWGTLQSRLISELRLRGITAIEAANSYLPEFMADYNRRFAVRPDMESSFFAPAPSPKKIYFYLSVEFQRITDNGSSFGFEGKRHQLVDEDGIVAKIPPEDRRRHIRHQIRKARRRLRWQAYGTWWKAREGKWSRSRRKPAGRRSCLARITPGESSS